MAHVTIDVIKLCDDRIYTREDAKPLFEQIGIALQNGDTVTVDFGNREIASESFLDEALVEHYLHPVCPEAQKKLILKNVATPDQALLRRIYDYRKRLEHKQKQQDLRRAKKAAKDFSEPSQVHEP
jgi:hypothetical protein